MTGQTRLRADAHAASGPTDVSRGGRMRKLIVVVLVLVGLVVLVDRVAVAAAQREIARQVAAQAALSSPPTVKIHGFPFLTQAVSGHYDEIDIAMGQVSRDGVTVDDVTADLRDIQAPLAELLGPGAKTIDAGSATATAVVPFATISRRVPSGLVVRDRGGDLLLTGYTTVAGFRVPVQALVTLDVTRAGIVATPRQIQAAGADLPVSVARQRLAFVVPVHQLPMGLRITRVHVVPDGLQVTASGTNVALTGS